MGKNKILLCVIVLILLAVTIPSLLKIAFNIGMIVIGLFMCVIMYYTIKMYDKFNKKDKD